MAKNIFNVPSTILDYSLDQVRRGSADIAHLVLVDIISSFLQSTSQGSYIFVALQVQQFQSEGCAPKNYKNIASLTSSLRKVWDEISPYKARDICANPPHQIKAVVQNVGGYIEYLFFGYLQLTFELIFFVINMFYLHPQ